MTFTDGYFTEARYCHCCGKIIPAFQTHFIHEKIKGCGILDFHVCEECHREVYCKESKEALEILVKDS